MRLATGIRVAAAAAVVMVGSVGCSSDVASTPPVVTPVASSTAPAERVELAVGDSFDLYEGTGIDAELEATITLTSLEVDPACEYSDPVDQTDANQGRAHHVALELTVDATGAVGPGFINAPSFDISEQLPDGFTSTSAAHSTEHYSCLPDRPIVDTVDAGTKVSGWMLFAVENATGALLWQNGGNSTGVTIAYEPSPTSTTTAPAVTTAEVPAAASTETSAETSSEAPAAAVTETSAETPAEVLPPEPDAAEPTAEECIGYGCSPEQDAELNEQEAAANEDYGPGCNYQLCGADLPENQPGYSSPEEPYRSSGEIQHEYGCQEGYIVGPECDGY